MGLSGPDRDQAVFSQCYHKHHEKAKEDPVPQRLRLPVPACRLQFMLPQIPAQSPSLAQMLKEVNRARTNSYVQKN